jgi:hypothetical protein
MTVLVDDAAWPWRGERWAHLVSDAHFEELHGFANRLGVRRLGFQGDHYDVPAAVRDRAVALGARPVSSRELVGALRAGGLRVRGVRHRWVDAAPGDPDVRATLGQLAAHWAPLGTAAWDTFLRRPGELGLSATVLRPAATAWGPVPEPLRSAVYLVERGDCTIIDVVVPPA